MTATQTDDAVQPAEESRETAASAPRSRRRGFVRRNLTLVISGSLILLIILLVLVLPFFLPDPNATDPVNRLLPPSAKHLMGTDSYGRDVLSRMATAGRISIGMTFLMTAIAATAGTFLGMVSGFFARTGSVIMRIVDAWIAFPAIILSIVFAVVIGPGPLSEVLAISIIFTPFAARIIRSRVLSLSTRTYVRAATISGMGPWKTLMVHIMPNTLPLALVQFIITAASAMLIDGSLSFLGLGISPPTPTWGNMVADGRSFLLDQPTLVIFPGLAIALFVLLVNLAGSSLRAFVDPRVRFLQEQQRLRSRGRVRA